MYRFHYQGDQNLARRFVTLMMEAISFPETSVLTRATRRHIPEDGIPDIRGCFPGGKAEMA
jgi:hypothetical protein